MRTTSILYKLNQISTHFARSSSSSASIGSKKPISANNRRDSKPPRKAVSASPRNDKNRQSSRQWHARGVRATELGGSQRQDAGYNGDRSGRQSGFGNKRRDEVHSSKLKEVRDRERISRPAQRPSYTYHSNNPKPSSDSSVGRSARDIESRNPRTKDDRNKSNGFPLEKSFAERRKNVRSSKTNQDNRERDPTLRSFTSTQKLGNSFGKSRELSSSYSKQSYRPAFNRGGRDVRNGDPETKAIGRRGPGYSAEMRKMAAEFAEMRKEELERFSPQSSKSTSIKSNSSLLVRSTRKPAAQSSPKPLSTRASEMTAKSKEPVKHSARKAASLQSLIIPVIQEAPDFVCINKPPALLSQPGLPGEGTILDLLRFQRPDLTLQTVNRYVYLLGFLTVGSIKIPLVLWFWGARNLQSGI
jgi:hypothetical protein